MKLFDSIKSKRASRPSVPLSQRINAKFRRQVSEGPLFNIGALIVIIWSISFVFILIWGFNLSLMSNDEMMNDKAHFFTHSFAFSNYIEAFRSLNFNNTNYFGLLLNSLWFSTGSTIMKLVATVFFAYVIARFSFPGRKILYLFVLIQMMLPVYGQTAANYKLLSSLGLVDSPLFLLAMGAGHGMYFMICHSYFETLPKDYEESARMDGCGYFRTFFQIMLPLATPILVCIGLITFISCWNDYQTTLLYLPHWRTLTSALYSYSEITLHSSNGSIAVYFAGVFMSALPIVILYIRFNKILMSNMTIGGIKG